MKTAILAREVNGHPAPDKLFCLRRLNSQSFWDGSRWADLGEARVFDNLDVALSVAGRLREKALELLVLFPATAYQLIIPLGGQGSAKRAHSFDQS